MKPEDLDNELRRLALQLEPLQTQVGRRGETAFLRVEGTGARSAVVISPGDRWFAVETMDHFSADEFIEDADDQTVLTILHDLVSIARSYVEGDFELRREGLLRTPVLVVSTATGPRTLRRSVASEISGLLSPNHGLN